MDSVHSVWLSAKEEDRLRTEGGEAFPDVLACLQQGAAWRARRDGKRLCEGPPVRRVPRAGATEVLYLWPLTTRRIWADLERERLERERSPWHPFWSSTRSDFCTAWIQTRSGDGRGYHCGRRRAEHETAALTGRSQ